MALQRSSVGVSSKHLSLLQLLFNWLMECFGSNKLASIFATCCLYNLSNPASHITIRYVYGRTIMQQSFQVIAVECISL